MPFAVRPDLDPGVVVVGVRPSGGVDLTRRDACGPERCDREHGLFTAPSESGADGGHRAERPPVGRTVGGLFVAPVIDLQGGVGEAHPLDAAAQRVRVYDAEIIEVLVVDPQRQDEVQELPLRDVPAHAVAHLQGLGHILLPVFPGEHQRIRQRHGRVQEINIVSVAWSAGRRQYGEQQCC